LLKIVSLDENNGAIGATARIDRAVTAEPDPPWDWHGARSRCLREASRLLRNRDDAEEAVQEALVRAWRRREACASPEAPIGWMLAITRNEALRLMERRARRTALEVVTERQPETGGDEPMETLISSMATSQALAALRPEERMLLALRYRHDLSQAEVARTMDLPEGTVKVRLHRLRKRLKDAWQEDSQAPGSDH
jgi:RNA polymerase sigma-70 factor, ECF subfamily